jgi:hypothetical protein
MAHANCATISVIVPAKVAYFPDQPSRLARIRHLLCGLFAARYRGLEAIVRFESWRPQTARGAADPHRN